MIKGKLEGQGPFKDIKVQIYLKISTKGQETFRCKQEKGGCTVDKNSSNPVGAAVNETTGEFTYTLNPANFEELEATQVVGVSVKEKNKFVNCGTSTVTLPIPKKTDVRDPKKLTEDDKTAIINAIKEAYKAEDGTSKLPNGTGDWDGVPAVIQIDDSGNAKIFSGNDVKGGWDSAGNFVPEKNEDGSVKLKEGAKPTTTIPAKDLVKNIAPQSPAIKVDTDTGKVTITPPAYKDPGDDTDLTSYTVTYKDASGVEKTVTATRTVDEASGKTTWTADNATVDENTGVITLKVEDIELAGTVKAIAKDNGGLIPEETPLDSDPATQTLETATVSYDANGGTDDMDSKTLNKGSKYKILRNAFTAPANQEFKTWEIDGKEVAPDTEITVTKDTTVKAVWKDIMVKIIYDPNGGNWNNDTEKKTIEVKKGTKITIKDAPKRPGYTFQYWKGSEYQPGDSYTANEDHTFTAQWKRKEKSGTTPGTSDKPGTTTPGTSDKPGTTTPGTSKTPETSTPSQQEGKANMTKPGKTAPKTGDASALSLCASGILAAGGAIALLKKRREER